jgi:hypothetical protein
LFGQPQQLDFTGSYNRVSEYVRRWRNDGGKNRKAAFISLKLELGYLPFSQTGGALLFHLLFHA